ADLRVAPRTVRVKREPVEREGEGYGLGPLAAQKIVDEGCKVLVTVDNGVSAHEAIALATAAGIDVVVTDHHLLPESLPAPFALVTPRLAPDDGEWAPLAGVGVAFAFAMGLRRELLRRGRPRESLPNLAELLDLVAIGTVADCVPLTGVNRILVAHGLKRLAWGERAGTAALMRAAGVDPGAVDAADVAFSLAPRLNAAGRMGSAMRGLSLLLTDDRQEAASLADELEGENRARKELQERTCDEALARLDPEQVARDRIAVVGGEGWKSGIVGIVASRLVERFGVPAVVVAFDGDGPGRGSARSLPGFDIAAALAQGADLLAGHGGHAMAAGLSVERERFAPFSRRMAEVAAARLAGADLSPVIFADATVDPARFDLPLIGALARLGPFGEGNRAPRFVADGASVSRVSPVGREGRHVRLTLAGGGAEAIGFHMADRVAGPGRYDLLFEPGVNRFNGTVRPQLRLVDLRPAGG
ncbi:MAG: single-stranded-DNA-specific exonuclease RecJ, partial [Nitrospinae bacterium]|nr:single-stranded-DNA-specific exonuclease RecJ [Nitrospinota bacterium]